MRFLFFLLILVGIGIAGWTLWQRYPFLRTFAMSKLSSDDFQTLEIRYTAEAIMESHRAELIKNASYSYLEPKLIFYPYILFDVKYAKDLQTTQEGHLLFGLTDGEMILDGNTWEKTHGFKDCLLANANSEDFNILRPLIDSGGIIERDRLNQKFKTDGNSIEKWIENCKEKKLIVVTGSKIRLHFDQPKFSTIPMTRLHEKLVTSCAKNSQKIASHFSSSQIKKLALAAFGADFAIRHCAEVYLPVYRIVIQNPDGSLLSTSWNALTGQRID